MLTSTGTDIEGEPIAKPSGQQSVLHSWEGSHPFQKRYVTCHVFIHWPCMQVLACELGLMASYLELLTYFYCLSILRICRTQMVVIQANILPIPKQVKEQRIAHQIHPQFLLF